MLQNIPKDKILDVVKQGPTFPAKIAKAVGSDTMLVGAILSTLISTGEVKVSTLKIGSSPLYYVPADESKLEEHIDHLNDKDQKTCRNLKEQKVLQDSIQDPLTRVSLRTIKDFAKSFEIDNSGQKVLFWRYFLVSKDEALTIAKSEIKSVVPQVQPVVEPTNKSINTNVDVTPDVKIAPNIVVNSEEHKIADHNNLEHHKVKEHHDAIEHHHKTSVKSEESEEVHEESKSEVKSEAKTKPDKDFFEIIKNHVTSKGLDIVSKEKVKKTEYNLILKNHDTNEYTYCKAKDKSSINEGDLAPALIFAQNKKMACLFISTGNLSKKTAALMTKEFNGLIFEKIE